MDSRVIGGILLVVGTSIGGGMLALPIASAGGGFVASSIMLILCWVAMMLAALLILEVNLWLPKNTNLISMARVTFGRSGAIFTWIVYLFLLYCLLCAFISSGTDLLNNLFRFLHLSVPLWISSCLFVLLFGAIVYRGIRWVDYTNRGLMTGKFLAYALLVICTLPYIEGDFLRAGEPLLLKSSLMVMITSYGFATVVPSLRTYFRDDVVKLRKVIIIGSFIPLVCYLLWILAIIGVVPRTGTDGLEAMMTSSSSTSDLVNAVQNTLHNGWINVFVQLFVSICVLTTFLAVSLGLVDFLADGLKVKAQGKGGLLVYAIAFLPPLILVIFYPGLFIKGLSFAGIACVILLLLLPALMAWRGRYQLQIAKGYRVGGGKLLLSMLIAVSVILLIVALTQM